MGRLSKYITTKEFTITQIRGFDNSLPKELEQNARILCTEILDYVRDYYNSPLLITSGYRCVEVNRKVGGSKTSQHVQGNACDFHILNVSLVRVFNDIVLGNIKDKTGKPIMNKIDQIILEGGNGQNNQWGWVHIGRSESPRNQKMTATFKNGRPTYNCVEKV
jgi:hypothetical protein